MNKTDMIAAIEAPEGLIDDRYREGYYCCAIGALAAYKNIEIPEEAYRPEESKDAGISFESMEGFAWELAEAYGCETTLLIDIQEANDAGYVTPQERKTQVLDYILALPNEDEDAQS